MNHEPLSCEQQYTFRDCADTAEERYLREILAMLQENYIKAAKPYIDKLVAIHSRSIPQMLVTYEQAQAFGLIPPNVYVTDIVPQFETQDVELRPEHLEPSFGIKAIESAMHDAVIRALDEAGVRNEVLRGMCIEVAIEKFRNALGD